VPAYLDHAATTPMRPEVVEAMAPFLRDRFGNPSGSHRLARDARKAVDEARDVVADALGCGPGEIVFTGGGTESDNTAVFGVPRRRPGAVVCSAIEHHAVLTPVEQLGGRFLPVDERGVVEVDAVADVVSEGTTLVSVMLANNEVGTIQPLAEVAESARERAPGVTIHTDAVQAAPWLDVAELATPADLISISAHKFGGPKGVGVLVVRKGTEVAPLLVGGGQEQERRSGTHNVAGIVGLAEALRLTVDERKATVERVEAMRDRLADGLRAALPDVTETGVTGTDRSHKVAGSCHLLVAGVEGESLLFLLEQEEIYASAASSCASGAMEPSHVLTAMGVPADAASLRLSLGAATVESDVDAVLAALPPIVEKLRGAP
jgi:cysteine desulfurase